ncbi:MAG: DUF6174 domain-containing protein, partial [Gammaproteobacteria bacterium]
MPLSSLHTTFNPTFSKSLIKYILIYITCGTLISACGGTNEETPVENIVTETVAPESTKATSNYIASEIQKNREKWMSHGISDYEIEMQKICYCIPEVVRMMV